MGCCGGGCVNCEHGGCNARYETPLARLLARQREDDQLDRECRAYLGRSWSDVRDSWQVRPYTPGVPEPRSLMYISGGALLVILILLIILL